MKSISHKYGTSNHEVLKRFDPQFETVACKKKHRYFYPVAHSKKIKKEMVSWIVGKYGEAQPYPKGDNKSYDIVEIKRNSQDSGSNPFDF